MKRSKDKIDFIKEFSVINNNKFTVKQTRSLYFGLLFQLINDKEQFKKNKFLLNFFKEVFKKEYKEYLFRSRPYLSSRLLNDISNEYDVIEISASIKKIILYLEKLDQKNEVEILEKNNQAKEKKIKNNSLQKDTISWYKSVKKGNDNK